MVEHHARGEDLGGRVGNILASNVRRRAVRGLEDRHVMPDVGTRRHAEAAHQAGTQVGDDIAVQIGQHEHVELVGVLHEPHAGGVHDLVVELDVGVVLGHLARHAQEEAVGLLHDVRLVHRGHPLATAAAGVLERVLHDAARAGDADGLDADGGVRAERLLAGALHQLSQLGDLGRALGELDAGVQVLGVLARDHEVDVAVARTVARHGEARAHAGIQVEVLAKRHVDAAETGTNRRGDGTLDGDLGLCHGIEHMLGQRRVILVHHARAGIHHLPGDLHARGLHHAAHGVRDLGSNAITRNEYDLVCHNRPPTPRRWYRRLPWSRVRAAWASRA